MENKLTLTAPDLQLGGTYRRHSSSSVSPTPPRSPTFLIHKPPSSPGGLSNCSSNGPDRNSLSPNVGRFFTLSSPTTKKVCTMDCAHCKHMAKNLRAASPIFNDSASAPCSRKSSVVVGKSEISYLECGKSVVLSGGHFVLPSDPLDSTLNTKNRIVWWRGFEPRKSSYIFLPIFKVLEG